MPLVTVKENGTELSPAHRFILDMVSRGAKNAEIADRLHYSLPWVKYYVSRLMREFGARNRAELAVMASRLDREPLQAENGYRVTHIGRLSSGVDATSYSAQFQVSAGETSVRVVVSVDPALAVSAGLRHGREHRMLVVLVRRLRSYLEEGIDLASPDHEVVIDREEELKGLLETPKCDFVDPATSRCRMASVSDPAGGVIDLDDCRCSLPPPDIRCQNLAIVTLQAVMPPGNIPAETFEASGVSCRANQPLSPACAADCAPGRRDCWSIMLKAPETVPQPAKDRSQARTSSVDHPARPRHKREKSTAS